MKQHGREIEEGETRIQLRKLFKARLAKRAKSGCPHSELLARLAHFLFCGIFL
jgi:hypothetical protein